MKRILLCLLAAGLCIFCVGCSGTAAGETATDESTEFDNSVDAGTQDEGKSYVYGTASQISDTTLTIEVGTMSSPGGMGMPSGDENGSFESMEGGSFPDGESMDLADMPSMAEGETFDREEMGSMPEGENGEMGSMPEGESGEMGSMPEGMSGQNFGKFMGTLEMTGEELTLDLTSATYVYLESDEGTADGSLSDIQTGDTLYIEYDSETNEVISITVNQMNDSAS